MKASVTGLQSMVLVRCHRARSGIHGRGKALICTSGQMNAIKGLEHTDYGI